LGRGLGCSASRAPIFPPPAPLGLPLLSRWGQLPRVPPPPGLICRRDETRGKLHDSDPNAPNIGSGLMGATKGGGRNRLKKQAYRTHISVGAPLTPPSLPPRGTVPRFRSCVCSGSCQGRPPEQFRDLTTLSRPRPGTLPGGRPFGFPPGTPAFRARGDSEALFSFSLAAGAGVPHFPARGFANRSGSGPPDRPPVAPPIFPFRPVTTRCFHAFPVLLGNGFTGVGSSPFLRGKVCASIPSLRQILQPPGKGQAVGCKWGPIPKGGRLFPHRGSRGQKLPG